MMDAADSLDGLRRTRDQLRAELVRLSERVQLLREQQADEEPMHAASSTELMLHEKSADGGRELIDELTVKYRRLTAEQRRLRVLVEELDEHGQRS